MTSERIAKAHTFQEDCWCNGPPITHEDDSYGDCITCREYVHHTEDEMRHVAFPCPTVRLREVDTVAQGDVFMCEDDTCTKTHWHPVR